MLCKNSKLAIIRSKAKKKQAVAMKLLSGYVHTHQNI